MNTLKLIFSNIGSTIGVFYAWVVKHVHMAIEKLVALGHAALTALTAHIATYATPKGAAVSIISLAIAIDIFTALKMGVIHGLYGIFKEFLTFVATNATATNGWAFVASLGIVVIGITVLVKGYPTK